MVTLTPSSPYACRLMFSSMPLSSVCILQLSKQILPGIENKYTDLRSLLRNVPANDKIVILCHFHARVGRDSETWKGVLEKPDAGNYSDNGRILLELCAEQQRCITNTIFQQKDQNTGT